MSDRRANARCIFIIYGLSDQLSAREPMSRLPRDFNKKHAKPCCQKSNLTLNLLALPCGRDLRWHPTTI